MGRILDLFLKIELWISINRRQKDILESSIYGISSNIVNSRFSILVTQCDDLLTLGQVKSRGRVKRASLLLYFRLILAIISSREAGIIPPWARKSTWINFHRGGDDWSREKMKLWKTMVTFDTRIHFAVSGQVLHYSWKEPPSFQITLPEPTTLSLYGCGNSSQVYALCMHRPNGRAILRARFEGIQGDGGNRVIMYIDKNKGTFFSFSLFRDYFLFLSEKHVKNTLIWTKLYASNFSIYRVISIWIYIIF